MPRLSSETKKELLYLFSNRKYLNSIKKEMGIKLPTVASCGVFYPEGNKDFCLGFLRGLLDSDGYISKNHKEITLGSISSYLVQDFVAC